MKIRALEEGDREEWLRMRRALWPKESPAQLADGTGEYFPATERRAVLVVERERGGLCGFIELSVRDWADGCETSDVGYIEGWYVDEDVRRQGVGRELVGAGEAWARRRGCREMGSDVETWNSVSIEAHGRLGYEESERLVAFCKRL